MLKTSMTSLGEYKMHQVFISKEATTNAYNATVVSQNNVDKCYKDIIEGYITDIRQIRDANSCLEKCMSCYNKKIQELVNCLSN